MLADHAFSSIAGETNGDFPCLSFHQRGICLEKKVLELSQSPEDIEWDSN